MQSRPHSVGDGGTPQSPFPPKGTILLPKVGKYSQLISRHLLKLLKHSGFLANEMMPSPRPNNLPD